MKVCDNGVIRDMTAEEVAEVETAQTVSALPSEVERIEALEAAVLELAEVIANG